MNNEDNNTKLLAKHLMEKEIFIIIDQFIN